MPGNGCRAEGVIECVAPPAALRDGSCARVRIDGGKEAASDAPCVTIGAMAPTSPAWLLIVKLLADRSAMKVSCACSAKMFSRACTAYPGT